jgi:uncharacterized protein (TIGR02117 family)
VPTTPPPKRSPLRRALRLLLRAGAAFLGTVALYVGLGYGLSAIRVDGASHDPAERIDIAIFTTPVHTDIVVPLRTDVVDWAAWLPAGAFDRSPAGYEFVSFGWGDRGFYLETPTWSDLKASTALTAVAGIGSSVMHVEFRDPPASYVGNDDFRMHCTTIDRTHYRELVEYLQGSFQRDPAGRPQPIPLPPALAGAYWNGPHAFFEAIGHYSLIRTCNVWTTDGMRRAGLPTPWWSPFPGAVTKHLPPAK